MNLLLKVDIDEDIVCDTVDRDSIDSALVRITNAIYESDLCLYSDSPKEHIRIKVINNHDIVTKDVEVEPEDINSENIEVKSNDTKSNKTLYSETLSKNIALNKELTII